MDHGAGTGNVTATVSLVDGLNEALDQIDELAGLEPDRDSYGGGPLSAEAPRGVCRVIADIAAPLAGSFGGRVEPDGGLGYLIDDASDGVSRYADVEAATWSDAERQLVRVLSS